MHLAQNATGAEIRKPWSWFDYWLCCSLQTRPLHSRCITQEATKVTSSSCTHTFISWPMSSSLNLIYFQFCQCGFKFSSVFTIWKAPLRACGHKDKVALVVWLLLDCCSFQHSWLSHPRFYVEALSYEDLILNPILVSSFNFLCKILTS